MATQPIVVTVSQDPLQHNIVCRNGIYSLTKRYKYYRTVIYVDGCQHSYGGVELLIILFAYSQ